MFANILLSLMFLTFSTEAQSKPEFTSAVLLKNKSSNILTFAGKTYYFDTVFKANFFRSMQFCSQQGMHLLSISNQIENDRIAKFIADNRITHGHFWTSATKLGDSNQWIWLSTGSNVIYTNWYPGEPNQNNDTENCLEVRYWPPSGFTWNDLDCAEELFFICETTADCPCPSIA